MTAGPPAVTGFRDALVFPAAYADVRPFLDDAAAVQAAVVWSCNQFGVPCICLKSITDIVREEDGGHEEFSASLHGAAMTSLAEQLPRVLDLVVNEVT